MDTYHWDVLVTYHWDVIGCFIWDLFESGDVLMRRRHDLPMRRHHDIPIRRREDVPLRRPGDVPLRHHWMFHLRRSCDVTGKYRETSLRRRHDVLLPGGNNYFPCFPLPPANEHSFNSSIFLPLIFTRSICNYQTDSWWGLLYLDLLRSLHFICIFMDAIKSEL